MLLLFFCLSIAAVPNSIKETISKDHPKVQFRVDDCFELDKNLWILIKTNKFEEGEIHLISQSDSEYFFSNGWLYTKTINNTIKSFDDYSPELQEALLQAQINQEFLIPHGFSLPRDLAMIAGHLPIALTNIQLQSEKEKIYREKIAEQKSKAPFRFLAYNKLAGELTLLEIDKDLNNQEIKITKLDSLNQKFKYISSIKIFDNQVYFADLYSNQIFQFNPDYTIQVICDLGVFGLDEGIRDFVINLNSHEAFILSNKNPKLLVVDLKANKLIKENKIAKMSQQLIQLNRGPDEAQQIFFLSKSQKQIFGFSSFDYRINSSIDLHSKDGEIIPYAFYPSSQAIYLAERIIDKNIDQGALVEYDPINLKVKSQLTLDFVPEKIESLNDEIYFIGKTKDQRAYLGKYNPVNQKTKFLDLGLNLTGIQEFTILPKDNFALVFSPYTQMLAFVDLDSFNLVRQIPITDKFSIIKSLAN